MKGSYGLLPDRSIKAVLRDSGLKFGDVDLVVVPGVTYPDVQERWTHHLRHLFGSCPKVLKVHHQMAHGATAFYGSGWRDTQVLSLDASGDGALGMYGWSQGEKIEYHHMGFPETRNSLGYFYTLMTQFCGFGDGDEYKLMGLAPYGKPVVDLSAILKVIEGGWEFDWSYVRDDPPCRSPFEPLYSRKITSILGEPRNPDGELTQFYKDVAASVQYQFEEALLSLARRMKSEKPYQKMVYAGGCALNCKANRRLMEVFPELYVSPVAGDRGLSMGCAYMGAVEMGDKPIPSFTAYLGTKYTDADIAKELNDNGVKYSVNPFPEEKAAEYISQGKIVGWFQGRSEAGARALGHRSILAKADSLEMKEKVNRKIKFREEFRPFAPAVLQEDSHLYFERGRFPYMTVAVKSDPKLGAVTHVDGTARVQTVSVTDSPRFHSLLKAVKGHTGTGVVLNTSFNLKGQPIVESPRDALATFFSCGLDALFVGNYLVEK